VEFFTDLVTNVPDGTPETEVEATRAAEKRRAAELAEQGHLLRLWRPPAEPGVWRTWGLFRAADEAELQSVLTSMPLHKWMTVGVTPLSPHPNDPGTGAGPR
jgi:muconolactone D-isomerase